jgi:hypothetical protein
MPKSTATSPELATAIQRAVEAALVAVQEKRQQKPAKPPRQIRPKVTQTAAKATKRPRKRGFRGLPPPPSFDFSSLPDSASLTEYETASVGRWSTNTLGIWRQRPNHPLKWTRVGGGRVRYRVADIRAFLAGGYRPRPGRPRKKKDVAPTAKQDPKRRRPRARDDAPSPGEMQ